MPSVQFALVALGSSVYGMPLVFPSEVVMQFGIAKVHMGTKEVLEQEENNAGRIKAMY